MKYQKERDSSIENKTIQMEDVVMKNKSQVDMANIYRKWRKNKRKKCAKNRKKSCGKRRWCQIRESKKLSVVWYKEKVE